MALADLQSAVSHVALNCTVPFVDPSPRNVTLAMTDGGSRGQVTSEHRLNAEAHIHVQIQVDYRPIELQIHEEAAYYIEGQDSPLVVFSDLVVTSHDTGMNVSAMVTLSPAQSGDRLSLPVGMTGLVS